MLGMIMHHQQAVEMTALIPSHTENKNLRSLGARSAVRSPTNQVYATLARSPRRTHFHDDARNAGTWTHQVTQWL